MDVICSRLLSEKNSEFRLQQNEAVVKGRAAVKNGGSSSIYGQTDFPVKLIVTHFLEEKLRARERSRQRHQSGRRSASLRTRSDAKREVLDSWRVEMNQGRNSIS
jgi:hypothetical protein